MLRLSRLPFHQMERSIKHKLLMSQFKRRNSRKTPAITEKKNRVNWLNV